MHGMSAIHLLILFMVALAIWAAANHLRGPRAYKDPKARSAPVMAYGLEQCLWDVGNIVKLIEQWEAKDEP